VQGACSVALAYTIYVVGCRVLVCKCKRQKDNKKASAFYTC